MSTVNIHFGSEAVEVTSGLTKVGDLYEKLGIDLSSKWLYLDKNQDIDIPLLFDDFIVVHGGEKIIEGSVNQQFGENPHVRNPVHPIFNGKKLEKGYGRAKVLGRELRKCDDKFESSRLFVDLASQVDAFIADEWILVIQDSDSYFTIPASDGDVVDLEECARSERRPPRGQSKYRIKIDGKKHDVNKSSMSGSEILARVGKTYVEWSLNQKFSGGRRESVKEDEKVDFAKPGIERFETIRREAQQGCAKANILCQKMTLNF